MCKMNLGDLNGIGKGVNKHWIYKDHLSRELAHDYLQKINYSMQDISCLLGTNKQIKKRTDIVSMIVMVDWIVDSVWQYKSCLLPNLLSNFRFFKQEALCKYYSFMKGIRSFIIAHPLATDKHKQFGFDGDVICVDLRIEKPIFFDYESNDVRRIGLNGIEEYGAEQDNDFYLYVYSKQDNAKFFKYFVIDFKEVFQVANIYIAQLYEIDRHLSKLKKKDYTAK